MRVQLIVLVASDAPIRVLIRGGRRHRGEMLDILSMLIAPLSARVIEHALEQPARAVLQGDKAAEVVAYLLKASFSVIIQRVTVAVAIFDPHERDSILARPTHRALENETAPTSLGDRPALVLAGAPGLIRQLAEHTERRVKSATGGGPVDILAKSAVPDGDGAVGEFPQEDVVVVVPLKSPRAEKHLAATVDSLEAK